jgi:lupus La protein
METSSSRYASYTRTKITPVLMNLQGSVFVEFEDMKTVEAFLNADPKPSWDGTELLIMSKCEISPFMASLL